MFLLHFLPTKFCSKCFTQINLFSPAAWGKNIVISHFTGEELGHSEVN